MTAFPFGLDVSRLTIPIDKVDNFCYNMCVRKRGKNYVAPRLEKGTRKT